MSTKLVTFTLEVTPSPALAAHTFPVHNMDGVAMEWLQNISRSRFIMSALESAGLYCEHAEDGGRVYVYIDADDPNTVAEMARRTIAQIDDLLETAEKVFITGEYNDV